MTIEDLHPTMLVQLRNSNIYQVLDNATIQRERGWLRLGNYTLGMLDSEDDIQFDIMEVRDCHILINMDELDTKETLHYFWMQSKVLWARNTSLKKLDLEIQELFKLLNSVGYD